MAEQTLQVSMVWLASDWQTPPVIEEDSLGWGTSPAFAVAGLEGQSRQPVLVRKEFTVSAGTTLEQFLDQNLTNIAQQALGQESIGVAVFGRRGRLSQLLYQDDRIELLGPIVADPKSDRRARVKADRSAGGRDKWRTTPAESAGD